jgi:hypothetical protein
MMADMTETDPKIDPHLYQLVLSLHAGAMQQMGKIASPFSGKVERDLDAARHTIDMLDMIRRKTEGNLSPDERKVLEHVLYELRLNFVDESKKGDTSESPSNGDSAETSLKKTQEGGQE